MQNDKLEIIRVDEPYLTELIELNYEYRREHALIGAVVGNHELYKADLWHKIGRYFPQTRTGTWRIERSTSFSILPGSTALDGVMNALFKKVSHKNLPPELLSLLESAGVTDYQEADPIKPEGEVLEDLLELHNRFRTSVTELEIQNAKASAASQRFWNRANEIHPQTAVGSWEWNEIRGGFQPQAVYDPEKMLIPPQIAEQLKTAPDFIKRKFVEDAKLAAGLE